MQAVVSRRKRKRLADVWNRSHDSDQNRHLKHSHGDTEEKIELCHRCNWFSSIGQGFTFTSRNLPPSVRWWIPSDRMAAGNRLVLSILPYVFIFNQRNEQKRLNRDILQNLHKIKDRKCLRTTTATEHERDYGDRWTLSFFCWHRARIVFEQINAWLVVCELPSTQHDLPLRLYLWRSPRPRQHVRQPYCSNPWLSPCSLLPRLRWSLPRNQQREMYQDAFSMNLTPLRG